MIVFDGGMALKGGDGEIICENKVEVGTGIPIPQL